MLTEGLTSKLLLIPVGVIATGEVLTRGAETVVLAAAALAGLGYIWAKVVRPTRRFIRRVARGIDLLEQLPGFHKEVTERLDDLDNRVHVIAEADKHRIKDALAGDRRGLIDRRAT